MNLDGYKFISGYKQTIIFKQRFHNLRLIQNINQNIKF